MELILTLNRNSTSNVPEGILLKFLSSPGQTLNEFLNCNIRKKGTIYSVSQKTWEFSDEFDIAFVMN